MKRLGMFLLWMIGMCTVININAQDVQFSQFYNAPLLLNPAFTGTTYSSRGIVNYRNQWPGIGKAFVSGIGSFDHYFAKFNSGVGAMVMQNKAGTSNLKSTEISGFYSYFIPLNDDWVLVSGLQATYVQRSIDYSAVTFPDQFNSSGFVGPTSEILSNNKKSYADFSTGGLLYSDKYWFGASYHHLNHPNQSFISGNQSQLPGELNLQAGARIPFASSPRGRSSRLQYPERAFIPSILYKSQGKFDQLDFGVNVLYEPIMVGLWYRGLPVKQNAAGTHNSESMIAYIGINTHDFTIGYSHDFVVSGLRSSNTHGANEIAVIYVFGDEKHKIKKKVKYKRLPCPGFYRKM